MADFLPTGEYVIRSVVSRPELNGQICSVSSSSFGAGMTTTYQARLQCTGEVVKLTANKLAPLSEAPAQMLYDEEDLQRDEHPLAAESMLLTVLRTGTSGMRRLGAWLLRAMLRACVPSRTVSYRAWCRLQVRSSPSRRSATTATAASASAAQTARKSPLSSRTFCSHRSPSLSLQTARHRSAAIGERIYQPTLRPGGGVRLLDRGVGEMAGGRLDRLPVCHAATHNGGGRRYGRGAL